MGDRMLEARQKLLAAALRYVAHVEYADPTDPHWEAHAELLGEQLDKANKGYWKVRRQDDEAR